MGDGTGAWLEIGGGDDHFVYACNMKSPTASAPAVFYLGRLFNYKSSAASRCLDHGSGHEGGVCLGGHVCVLREDRRQGLLFTIPSSCPVGLARGGGAGAGILSSCGILLRRG